MTLAQRYHWATVAIGVTATLQVTFVLSQFVFIAALSGGIPDLTPASLQGVPFNINSAILDNAALILLGGLLVVVGGLGERDSTRQRLAALRDGQESLPPTTAPAKDILETQPERFPVTLRYETSPARLTAYMGVMLSAVVVSICFLYLAFLAYSLLADSAPSFSAAFPFLPTAVICALLLVAAIVYGIWQLRSTIGGVIADNAGIRAITSRGEGPTLAWADLRLFEVSVHENTDSPVTKVTHYQVMDTHERRVSWVLTDSRLATYLPAEDDEKQARDTIHALNWLIHTHAGLTPRQAISSTGASIYSDDSGMSGFEFYTDLTKMVAPLFLAVATLSFHGLWFPIINILAGACFIAYTLIAVACVARQNIPIAPPTQPITSHWRLLMRALLFIGVVNALAAVLPALVALRATGGSLWNAADARLAIIVGAIAYSSLISYLNRRNRQARIRMRNGWNTR